MVTVANQQQQPKQQPGLQRLQQLLAANAAVPAGQLAGLRQLDLSLEQLLDLQGLGQLCPQLTVSDTALQAVDKLLGMPPRAIFRALFVYASSAA
jgi:hypothetical protein